MNQLFLKFINYIYKLNYKFFLKNKMSKYNVKSIEDTIYNIKYNNKSISRFGDGEFSFILKKNKKIKFEQNSDKLSEQLKRVLLSNNENVLIGLPEQFRKLGLFSKDLDDFYIYIFNKFSRPNSNIFKYLDTSKIYYNTEFTRVYLDYVNKRKSEQLFKSIRDIWKDKDVLLIEGEYTRFGVGNNLLSSASSVSRIECPSVNAFSKYNEILICAKDFLLKNNEKRYITLIALGPTATILAYDLGSIGYQSIDIGHLDLEYEWYLMRAKKRINIPDRYVNEVNGGNKNIKEVKNEKYLKEIKKKIL